MTMHIAAGTHPGANTEGSKVKARMDEHNSYTNVYEPKIRG